MIIAVSVFLPWVELSSSASYMGQNANYSSGGISGINFGGGIFGLLVAIAGCIMTFNKIKWTFVTGIITLFLGIAHVMGWMGTGNGISFSSDIEGAHLSAGIHPQYGLYIFIIASVIFIFASIISVFDVE